MAINVAEAKVLVSAETQGEERIRRLRQELDELTKATGQNNAANNAATKSDALRRQSMVQLGQQIGDVGVQLQMGTSAARVFAMQSGQVGFALAGMGGQLGKVGAFLAGPWGAALTIAVSTLGMMAEELLNTESGMKDLRLASDALGEAQSTLGAMFDLTTGKLKSQNDMLRLNAQLMAIKLRAEAAEKEASSGSIFDDARTGNPSLWDQVKATVTFRPFKEDAATSRRAKALEQTVRQIESGATKASTAAKWAETFNFDGLRTTRKDFLNSLADRATVSRNRELAGKIDESLEDGVLDPALRRPGRTKKPRKSRVDKSDPYGDALTQLGGDREQMEFQLQALDKYGEKLASTKRVLIEWNIEHGKYGSLTADQKTRLLAEATAYDTAADALRRKTKAAKEAKDTDKDVAEWRAENEAIADEAKALTMTTLQYRHYTEAKAVEAEISKKRMEMEPDEFARWERERRAALATKQALEEYNDERAKTAGDGTRRALKDYGEEIANVGQSAFNAWTRALKGTEDALANFTMTGKLSFKDFANSVIADLARIAIQRGIMNTIMGVLNSVLPFGSVGSTAAGSTGAFAGMKAANGAAFGAGGFRKFATGGIVSGATPFSYSGGMGVMGEAGPEAIMPLKRLSNGKLGVHAEGGGSQSVVVNVNVESGNSEAMGDPGKAAQLGNLIAGVVRNELVVQKRPGGILAAA